MTIAANIAGVRERIARAAARAGREASQVSLMAVSKTNPAARIAEAFAAGQLLFGENRVQEFAGKHAELEAAGVGAEFHLIGHLQSNKAARAVELFQAIDSVDSLRLAERLNDAAAKLNRRLPILLEVNIGGEQAKSGLVADSGELLKIVQAVGSLSQLELRGLMTVPPFTEGPESTRPYFRRLRELRDHLAQESGLALPALSMGMSHDFEVAIEEGSTCVRVGTAIFGERSYA